MIRASRTHLALLFLIVVFAGLLRGFGISVVGYWTDELCSLSCANGWGLQLYKVPTDRIIEERLTVCTRVREAASIWKVPGALARDDTHPPVYSLLLRGWESIFGDNESGTRSMNICFSLITIVLIYVVAMQSVGASTALWVALLMAVASPQISFSLESRDYMLALLFCLSATVAFFHLEKNPTVTSASVLGLMLLLAMLTHYYSAGIAAALVLHAVIWWRGRSRWLVVAAAVISGILFLLLWGPYFVREIPNFTTNTAYLIEPVAGRYSRWLLRFCRVPAMLEAADLPNWSAIFGALFLLLPIAYVRRPELRLWVLWFVCTVGLIAGQDLIHSTTQMTLPRYLLFATPAAYVLLAGAIRGPLRSLPPVVAVVMALLALHSAYAPAWKIDLRTPVRDFVAPMLQPGDGIVVSGPDPIFDGITYAAFQHYLPKMPAASAVLARSADNATLHRLRECPSIWLLWMWPGRPVAQVLPGFVADDRGHMPYFGDLIHGHFRSSEPATQNTEGIH